MGNKRLYPNHILQTRIYLMKLIIYGTGIFSEVLLDEIYENSKEVVAFTLDDELIDYITIEGDDLTRTDIILSFQIIFFNAKNNSLNASIPIEVSKILNSSKQTKIKL